MHAILPEQRRGMAVQGAPADHDSTLAAAAATAAAAARRPPPAAAHDGPCAVLTTTHTLRARQCNWDSNKCSTCAECSNTTATCDYFCEHNADDWHTKVRAPPSDDPRPTAPLFAAR